MKLFKILFLITIIILTTGCWNYREIGDLAIVGGIGVDWKDNQYNVSVEVLNVKKVANNAAGGAASGNEAAGVIYEATGHTLTEAMAKFIYECPKDLFIGHLKLLAIGEEAAKKGVLDFLDYFTRATESRETFSTVIVKGGTASDLLKVAMPIEPITSFNIQESVVETPKVNSTISNKLFDQLLMCLFQEGREPTVPAVEITGPQEPGENTENLSDTAPKTSAIIVGTSVFKGDKLVGYLNVKESTAYTIIRGLSQTLHVVFPCDNKDHYGTVTLDKANVNVKMDLVDNKPVAKIDVTGDSALTGINCKIDLKKESNIKKLEEFVNKSLKKDMSKTIKKVQQKYKSDIFGFGERLYKDHYNKWKKVKNNWDDKFSTMKYNVKVNISIKSLSSTINSIKEG